MPSTPTDYALDALADCRETTNNFLISVPEDKWLHQPLDGANHVRWVVGHLAVTDDWLANLYDGKPKQLPDLYEKLFGMGSTPTTDAAAYPSIAEVRRAFDDSRERLRKGVEAAGDAVLAESMPKEMENFAPNKLAMVHRLVWHEGMHAGQITVVRKSLGLAPAFA